MESQLQLDCCMLRPTSLNANADAKAIVVGLEILALERAACMAGAAPANVQIATCRPSLWRGCMETIHNALTSCSRQKMQLIAVNALMGE